jgi:predicted Zn-ribbon and HTH transcriptional regulator
MTRKPPNLTLSLPKCRQCGCYWRPAQGVVADSSSCRKCVSERREMTSSTLGLKPIADTDVMDNFLMPRRLRHR